MMQLCFLLELVVNGHFELYLWFSTITSPHYDTMVVIFLLSIPTNPSMARAQHRPQVCDGQGGHDDCDGQGGHDDCDGQGGPDEQHVVVAE